MFGKLYLSFLVLVAIAIGIYVHNHISQNNKIAQKVQSLIQENEKADLKALESFSVGVDEVFENYKKNVHNAVVNKPEWQAFWERIIKWNKEKAIELFNQHFNKEIFGKEDASLISLINDFEYKLEANRNNLCSNLSFYIDNTKHTLSSKDISDELKKQMKETFSNTLGDSVNNLIVKTVSSLVAEELTRYATTTAIATFSAAGVAGGTAVGPAGTVVGVAVGFGVGWTVEHFMEKSNNEKMEASIIQALDSAKEGTKRVLMDKLQKKIKNLNKGYLDEFKKNCM